MTLDKTAPEQRKPFALALNPQRSSRVTQRTSTSSTVAYTYDAAGQVTQERQTVSGAPAKVLDYQYDLDGNRTRLRVSTP